MRMAGRVFSCLFNLILMESFFFPGLPCGMMGLSPGER